MPTWLSRQNDRVRDLYRPSLNVLRSRLIFETNADCKNTAMLSSGGRTGSTWVAEIITRGSGYRYLYEPASLYRVLVTPKYAALLPGVADGVARMDPLHYWQDRPPFDNRLQYIRPEDDDADLRRRALGVLSGRFHHPEVDQYNHTSRIVFAKRFIKEVKSNLWIAWLHRQFPSVKLILLIRHPIPTIQSRLEGKRDVGNQAYYEKLVFGQSELVADHLQPFLRILRSAQSAFQQRLAVWCIQNYVPLQQLKSDDVHLAFYEHMCLNPEAEIRRVFAFLGWDNVDRRVKRALRNIQKPSATYHQKETIETGIQPIDQVSRWMKKATREQLAQTDEMLSAFGLSGIYSSASPMPQPAGARAIMQRNERTAQRDRELLG